MNTNPPLNIEPLKIRPERADDLNAIGHVTITAFAPMSFSSGTEARIIQALREAGVLTVSLVATTVDGAVIGHIAFSPVTIDGQASDWYALGPVSVAPQMQRRGLGSALITRGLTRLREMQAGGCVLLGRPAYYGRFGFLSDPTLTYQKQPNRFFQRLGLAGGPMTGDVRFHPAFDVS